MSTLWVVGVGCQAEVSRPAQSCDQLPPQHVARQRAGTGTKGPRGRELSCVTRGRLCLIAAVWHGQDWPQARLWPEDWPERFPPARQVSAAQQHKQDKARQRQRLKRRKRKAAQRAIKRLRKRAA